MLIQLNPPLPILTPKGNGIAWFLIDPGIEHDLQWVVVLDENGEIWTFQNRDVRADKNITMGRANVMNPTFNKKRLYTDHWAILGEKIHEMESIIESIYEGMSEIFQRIEALEKAREQK